MDFWCEPDTGDDATDNDEWFGIEALADRDSAEWVSMWLALEGRRNAGEA